LTRRFPIVVAMKIEFFHGGRSLLLSVSVVAALALGFLHGSMVDAPHTPGLGRLGRDLLRRAAIEVSSIPSAKQLARPPAPHHAEGNSDAVVPAFLRDSQWPS
jgi:hypothetical protein